MLSRRFRRVAEGEEEAPDLVLVDGGKGQLSMAQDVMADLGLDRVPIAALAKSHLKAGPGHKPGDEKERTEERIFLPGRKNPVLFPPRSPAFYLLQRLRDEAHRFVNTYHGKLRRKSHLRSSLEDIPGVGPRRAKALLKHFGSLARVKETTLEDLANAPTMNETVAQEIVMFYAEKAEG